MLANLQETADLVTVTKEIINEKLHFYAVLLRQLLHEILVDGCF